MTRVELTTVSTDGAVFHVAGGEGVAVEQLAGLDPATAYRHRGVDFTTLPRPSGALRCTFATVNDVHFGETEAGRVSGSDLGPILSVPDGATPYPEVMNRAAVAELRTIDLVAVIVKGDLTSDGRPEEFAAFEACYRPPFGDRLHVVRGNHDAYRGQDDYAGDRWIELPGVNVALLDTVTPAASGGALSGSQLDQLDANAAGATAPVVVMGHHPQWFEGMTDKPEFLLGRAASRALDDLFVRRDAIVAYTSGHTHRHLVHRAAGGVPSIEVGCVKDFPGVWTRYDVYDGGIVQTAHRISAPDALAWSEQCRVLYRDFGIDYTTYALGQLNHRCLTIPWR